MHYNGPRKRCRLVAGSPASQGFILSVCVNGQVEEEAVRAEDEIAQKEGTVVDEATVVRGCG